MHNTPPNYKIYHNKKVAVLGLGVSGIACATFLIDNGATVYAWDDNENSRATADKNAVPVYDLNTMDFTNIDFALASPGIGYEHPVLQSAKQCECPIIGEVQLLWQCNPNATYIGITGTNGKSTTTALIYHVLKTAGIVCAIGGNFGTPAVALPKLGNGEVYILELSSYMLERIPAVRFNISVFLNLSPDHLQRHNTMQGYLQAKSHIFDNMTSQDTAVICTDDDYTVSLSKTVNHTKVKAVSYIQEPLSPIAMPGNHNKQNIACVRAVAQILNISNDIFETAIHSFQGLEHRQSIVRVMDYITFINDSKATNAESTAKALGSYDRIYWIAGGQEKQGGYDILTPYLPRIEKAYLIGEAAHNIGLYLQDHTINYTIDRTLETAIKDAFNDAKQDAKDSVILLSPACASWDQFNSFEHRGECFKDCVERLEYE